MAASNGKAVESNDRVVVTPERSKPRSTSRVRWTVGLLVRLCIWYFLLTPFFRCPSNVAELTDSSPRICKPYLAAKSYVEPHVTPYYNTYAAPYVDAARPYVVVLNEKVYTPASNIAKQGYQAYGAPALNRAQAYGQQQWDANVVPHIETTKAKAADWYGAQVAPHVDYVVTTVSPYYNNVRGAYWKTVDGYILPFAAKYQPYIGKTYTSGQEILTTTVMPHAQNAWYSTVYFIYQTLWPKMSSLYSENVEPQLVKIGQRLASYREGDRLRSVAAEAESAATFISSTAVETTATEPPTASFTPEPTPTPSLSPSQLAAQIREKIASDLVTWKERFASASEKGVESLEGRVVEIVDTYVADGAQSEGEKLVNALESAVEEQTAAIKNRISGLTEALPVTDSPEEEEAAIEELLKEVRSSAVSIRDRAHVLREWHVSFEQNLLNKVAVAVNSTLAVLDNVRDLGLQEIGMRWALMDGVTYKDWEDYHALKEEFEDWKVKFREIALQHARIEAVKEHADETLSRGMDVAEAAAKELARLKEVGRWKIAAREVSEDFDTRSEPPPPLSKPNVDAEEIPVVQEDQEVPSEAEEKSFELNDTTADSNAEKDDESPELGEVHEAEKIQETASDTASESTVFSGDSADDDSTVDTELPEREDAAVPESNPFGAAAAAVLLEKAAAEVDDADRLELDEVVVDAEATKISEALSESLKFEDLNTEPTPSQAPAQQQQSIEELLSHILADTDPAFADKVLKRLNAIYETPQPIPDTQASTEISGSTAAASTQAADSDKSQFSQVDL
ncbi:uncharacterized protein DSM5745_02288 [Aspergillus mulundensis]|uniref:Transcription factor hoxa13 n=1 Tax=Aspergillus mulundensis TaxID=1810919 RepID=A0A3D8SW32_9EURO|nr:Uncharacterized protein DSM5745_02288 [Aspergillus mulundensis]RDW90513.1 Uncharacterized protein DSM5745_02288 [Aspergillus mulundensis]